MRYVVFGLPLLLYMLAPVPVGAVPGQLDPSYGDGGIASMFLDGEGCFTSVLQPDGKVVMVGAKDLSPSRQLAAIRFNADGTPDPTFGVGGLSVIGSAVHDPQPHGVVVLPNGKLIISGFISVAPNFSALVRLNADGSLDTTFGSGGVLDVPIVGAHTVALQNGMVLVGGNTAGLSSGLDFGVARYDVDGVLDTSFGTGGLARADFTSFDLFSSVMVQTDGRIVAVGETSDSSLVSRFGVARFLQDGTPDATFGTGGLVRAPTISEYDIPAAATEQSTGDVIVGGYVAVSHPNFLPFDWGLAALAVDGAVDSAFGAGGAVRRDFAGHDDFLVDVLAEADDRVLAAGYATFGTTFGTSLPVVARYHPNGTPDLSWGALGLTTITVPNIYNGEIEKLHTLPDKRVIGTGIINLLSGSTLCAAVRFVNNTCGNGVIEPGEECDDGNTADGDCCSSICQFEPPGHSCASDGIACTLDQCDGAGSCRHPAQVLPGCRRSTVPLKSALTIKDSAKDTRDALAWTWQKGEATAISDLGNPLVSTAYTLCGIDLTSSASPALLFEIDAPAGGTCGSAPCWNVSGGNGFRYRDRDGTPSGMSSLVVKAGAAGKAKATAKAHGVHLDLPSLPLPLPAMVQLRASNGRCFESTFSAAGVKRNDTAQFKGKAD